MNNHHVTGAAVRVPPVFDGEPGDTAGPDEKTIIWRWGTKFGRWEGSPSLPPEVRITSETGGSKGQKQARLGSLDPRALLTVAEVAGFGERKYSRLNYMNGYDWSLCFDALQRHILAFWDGEDLDPESGLPHTAHAAWHCLALLAFMQRGLGTDDRYKP